MEPVGSKSKAVNPNGVAHEYRDYEALISWTEARAVPGTG